MKNFIIAFVVLMLSTPTYAQQQLNIEGPENIVGHNEIVEFKTNIEITYDDDELPSHTIEWEVPTSLEDKTRTYYDGTVLAIPSGCKDMDIEVRIRTTDWNKRRIEKAKFLLKVRKDPNDPIVVEPDPIDPTDPIIEPVVGNFYELTKTELPLIDDPTLKERCAELHKGFGIIVGQIKDKKFTSVNEMMAALRSVNNGEFGGVKPWSVESRLKWQNWRNKLSMLFAGKNLTDVEDFINPFQQIQTALKEGSK